MAHTADQRDQRPLCGAKKKNGELCRAFAGQGTSHPGTGRCKFHFGNSESHDKQAVKRELTRRMVTMGEPIEDVTAMSALLSELYASTGHVAWLRQQIADMSPEHLGTIEGQAIIRLYDTERDRKTKIAKMATEAGVDEAQIHVAEAQVTLLGQALARACDAAGVSAPLRQRIGAELRTALAEAQTVQPVRLGLVAGSSS
jgi:methylphosphotriester-DNA--protein-cysteine methyltransferase